MSLCLAPELCSFDFETDVSLFFSPMKIVVYLHQRPLYQIDSISPIKAATVYRDRIYLIVEHPDEVALLIYDAELGAQLQSVPLMIPPPLQHATFVFYDQLYVVVQQQNVTDSIRLCAVLGDTVLRAKLKLAVEGEQNFTEVLSELHDFAFNKRQMMCFDPHKQLLYTWALPEQLSDERIFTYFLASEPKKIESAQYLLLDGTHAYQLYLNPSDYYDSEMVLTRTENPKNELRYQKIGRQHILVQAEKRLVFLTKQLMLQYLSSSNLRWTQEETFAAAEMNEFDQRIKDFEYDAGHIKIQFQYAHITTTLTIDCPPGKPVGYLFVQKQRLIIAVQHSAETCVYVVGDNYQQKLVTLPNQVCKVIIRFDQSVKEILDFESVHLGCQYEKHFELRSKTVKICEISGQLVDFQLKDNQITYATKTLVGLVENNLPLLQIPLKDCLSTTVCCKNCFCFLTKKVLHMVIAENSKIYRCEAECEKYSATSVRFVEGFVELYGQETFRLIGNVSNLVQAYQLLYNQSKEGAVIVKALSELVEPKFDGSVYAKLILYRKDRDQILKVLLKKFPYNFELVCFAMDFDQDRDYLEQLYVLLSQLETLKQFQLFQKLLFKIDRLEQIQIFNSLLTNNNFDQLNGVFINYVLYKTLQRNPPLFIVFAKTIGATDRQIVNILEQYKTDLISVLNEKQIFVFAKQCMQQFQTNQQIRIASATKQEQFMTLLQTILQVYQLNPVSGQQISIGADFKQRFQKLQVADDYQLPPNQYQFLKQMIFGQKQKDYAVSDYRLMRLLPIFTEKQEIKEEVAVKSNENFLSKDAQVLKVGEAQDDWDDGGKKKKTKKIVIKAQPINAPRADSWSTQWGVSPGVNGAKASADASEHKVETGRVEIVKVNVVQQVETELKVAEPEKAKPKVVETPALVVVEIPQVIVQINEEPIQKVDEVAVKTTQIIDEDANEITEKLEEPKTESNVQNDEGWGEKWD